MQPSFGVLALSGERGLGEGNKIKLLYARSQVKSVNGALFFQVTLVESPIFIRILAVQRTGTYPPRTPFLDNTTCQS